MSIIFYQALIQTLLLAINTSLTPPCYESGTCEEIYDLTVVVDGISDEAGILHICLASSEKQFLKECFMQQSVEVSGQKKIAVQLNALPRGEYAISVFHDLNRNTRLDSRVLFHLPKEPFGFSNNPKLVFGPPRFSDCQFRLDQNVKEVTIRLRRV